MQTFHNEDRMGGCRCTYKDCIRATKNSDKDFHFFHYPVKDPTRCLRWINNAKKSSFQDLPEDQLRNKVVCQLHFKDQYFTNANKKRLVHNAVPSLDGESVKPESLKPIIIPVPAGVDMEVEVLQRDSEGSVFTVDTDILMQTELGPYESYIIHNNGNIVPADLTETQDSKSSVYNNNASDEVIQLDNDLQTDSRVEFVNPNRNYIPTKRISAKHLKKFSHLVPAESLSKSPSTTHSSRFQSSTNVIPTYEMLDRLRVDTPEEDTPTEEMVASPPENKKNNELEVINLSKIIQKHSKEIASLKRILSTKMKKSRCKRRLTNIQIINQLRGLLPTTLHGALSLQLLNKSDDFSETERAFLISLYTASPATYNMLLKEWNWKLPTVDVVETLILKEGNYVR